jgi:hypothetical protein
MNINTTTTTNTKQHIANLRINVNIYNDAFIVTVVLESNKTSCIYIANIKCWKASII